jgi:Rho GTPase-activating protein 1
MPPASLNLKQRLVALSLGPSSPNGPDAHTRNGQVNGNESYPRSPTGPSIQRKQIFNPPSWVKQPRGFTSSNIEISVGEEGKRMMQDVMSKMIFQAGVDFECALISPEFMILLMPLG